MSDPVNDLPPITAPNFLLKVREAVGVITGNRGDGLQRSITVQDLVDAEIITMQPGYLNNQGRVKAIGGTGTAIPKNYVIDITPPPTPTGFAAVSAISNILIECDIQSYTVGHGHAKSALYGIVRNEGDPVPVFDDAQLISEFPGSVHAYATNPATTWHLWLKWVSADGHASTMPAGGTHGVVITTGQNVDKLVKAMTGPGNPFKIVTEPITLEDGTIVPVGTYTADAFIHNSQITNAKIANLAVDNAKIANLSVSKLTAGSMAVGQYIQSTNYVPGSVGWRISADGTAELANAVVRGAVYAVSGHIGSNTIDASGMQSAGFELGVSGWRLDKNGSLYAAKGLFAGSLMGANIEGATGNFAGSLRGADITGCNGLFTGTLYASRIIAGSITAGNLAPKTATDFEQFQINIPERQWVAHDFFMHSDGKVLIFNQGALFTRIDEPDYNLSNSIQPTGVGEAWDGTYNVPTDLASGLFNSYDLPAGPHLLWAYHYVGAVSSHALFKSYR